MATSPRQSPRNQHEMLCLAVFLLLALAPPRVAAAVAATVLVRGPDVEAASCPYDLATAAQMIPRECHANATVAQGATGCCWYVFAAYIFAAADHANRTGEAFLPPDTAAACSDAFAATLLSGGLVLRSLLAGNGSCDLTGDPDKLAAGSHPCQLATIDGVRALAPRALPNATRLCAAPGSTRAPGVGPDTPGCSECRGAVIAATYEMLASARTKEFVPCGMATTVAVWSRVPPPLERFRAYALCMLQVLENVNSLGTGDLVPSPPPPALATELPPPPAASRSSSRKNTVPITAGSAAAGVVAILGIAFAAVAIARIRRRRRLTAGDEESGDEGSDDDSVATLPPLPREGLYIFTKEELMQATNGYDKKLLLGTGGAGKVYLGHLPSGQHVAIKKLYRSKKVAEFYAEVAVLAKLRHRNLTTLVGYCLGGRCGDHALVYEYMAGGNLWRALFQGDLSWRRRLEVAVDVAEGLAYLHGFCEGAVVHRDVKPTNVLLSESGTAKLSDFGVSRIVPEGGTHVSTEVRGTRGYVDPESFSAGHVSETADVYSFGVVLLELTTGMRAVVPTPSGGAESIVQAAHWAAAEAGGEGAAAETMVDRRLGTSWDRPTVRAVFALACRCVRPYKHERPAIAEVLAELKAILADYNTRVSGDGDGSSLDAERSEGTASSSAATLEPVSLPPTLSSTANTEVLSTPSLRGVA
ncbi:proline-rich receptor-like protein kinase PERK3 [Phragmites australis]|uniref:proline-rich receptor-like protein kinase PERK3 n=1 Tax=Phragmites australis TaxID=29695 RepID=UPI002D7A39E9|nr:proline-rich receptor-like protein kinase PERK3 [Phragmites australis]